MSMKDLLLSFKGRIGRKTYWMWNIFYYIAITGFASGISVLFPAYSYILLPIFLLLLVIPDLAVTAKRWHDRNKSNYWLLLNIPLVFGRLASPMTATTTEPVSSTHMVATVAALVCGLWILIECGLMKGTEGRNDYGEDPV
ncbi:DUF805 domain-containing protein [uncultured Vibrio sp.]|uniref:DUF805 domain-containing protein n=1 Tax=uncultured Vibrio sp. TaxID=114054 RepID=UPI00260F0056|nr:DUF805 domain-containing protein [uncultured Vibrio sp.]